MYQHQKKCSDAGALLVILVFINVIILKEGFTSSSGSYWLLCLTVPLMVIATVWNRRQTTKDKQP